MARPFPRAAAVMRFFVRAALVVAAAFLLSFDARPAVKYGDAVPGVIHPSDIERIKRILNLDRFSIIAAVRLGAAEGREVVLAEPLSSEALARLKDTCDSGGFCPDPTGFVASRVRVVLLQAGGVDTVVVVQDEPRGPRGRLVNLREWGITGGVAGWSGSAAASDGHVALRLTPLVSTDGRWKAGLEPPLLIRFNPKRDRFQVYDCVAAEDGGAACDFLDEPGD